MTVKGFSRINVSIYFYRFHLYSLCCRSQKLPIPSVSYMNPDVKKKKGKMKQPANMSLYSECRGLAWSQALWEKCDYQTLAEDARKGRMTSVFPSCRISHDISCSEEHFIGSHKPLSPVLSLLQPILLSSHHFTFFNPPPLLTGVLSTSPLKSLLAAKLYCGVTTDMAMCGDPCGSWLSMLWMGNGTRAGCFLIPSHFPFLRSQCTLEYRLNSVATWAGVTFMIISEGVVKSLTGGEK